MSKNVIIRINDIVPINRMIDGSLRCFNFFLRRNYKRIKENIITYTDLLVNIELLSWLKNNYEIKDLEISPRTMKYMIHKNYELNMNIIFTQYTDIRPEAIYAIWCRDSTLFGMQSFAFK